MAPGTEKTKDKKENECKLCSEQFTSKEELKEHFWSLTHHKKVEEVSKNSLHNCTVCFTSCHSLEDYGKHLKSEKHNAAVTEERKAAKERKDNPHQPPPLPPPPVAKPQPPRHKPPPLLPNLCPPHPSYFGENKQKKAHQHSDAYGKPWHSSRAHGSSTDQVTPSWRGAHRRVQPPGTCDKPWNKGDCDTTTPLGAPPMEGLPTNTQNEWFIEQFTSDGFFSASSSWQQSTFLAEEFCDNYNNGWYDYSCDWNNDYSKWNWDNDWNAYNGDGTRRGKGRRFGSKAFSRKKHDHHWKNLKRIFPVENLTKKFPQTGNQSHVDRPLANSGKIGDMKGCANHGHKPLNNNNNIIYHKGQDPSLKGKWNSKNKTWAKSAKSKRGKGMAKKMTSKVKTKKKSADRKKSVAPEHSPEESQNVSIKNFSQNHSVKNLTVTVEKNSVQRTVSSESFRHLNSSNESGSTSAAASESSMQTSEIESRKTAEYMSKSSALTNSNKPNVTKLPKLNNDMAKKDSFAQMVKSPRSWRDRHKLAEMMRKHVKAVPKRPVSISNLHLSEMFADVPAPAGEVHLENLPSQLQVKIANLIEPYQEMEQSSSKDVMSSAAGSEKSAKPALNNDSELHSILKAIKTESGLQDSEDKHLSVDSGVNNNTTQNNDIATSENSPQKQVILTLSKKSSVKPGSGSVRSESVPNSKSSGTGNPDMFRTSGSCPVTASVIQPVSSNQNTCKVAKMSTDRMSPSVVCSSAAERVKVTIPTPVNSGKSDMIPTLASSVSLLTASSPSSSASSQTSLLSSPSSTLTSSSATTNCASGLGRNRTTTLAFQSVTSTAQSEGPASLSGSLISQSMTSASQSVGTVFLSGTSVSRFATPASRSVGSMSVSGSSVSQPVISISHSVSLTSEPRVSVTASLASTVTTASSTGPSVATATLPLPILSSPQTSGRVRKKSPRDPSKRKRTSPDSPHSLAEPKEPGVRISDSSASETLSYVNRVLELSMKEESLRREVLEVNSQMEMVHRLLLNYQLRFSALDHRRTQLLNEEESLRSERMKILQEAVSEAGPRCPSGEIVQKTLEPRAEDTTSTLVSIPSTTTSTTTTLSSPAQVSSIPRLATGQLGRVGLPESSLSHVEPGERQASCVEKNLGIAPDCSSINSVTQESCFSSAASTSGVNSISVQRGNGSASGQPNPDTGTILSGLSGVVVKVEPLSDTEDVVEQVSPGTSRAVSYNGLVSNPNPVNNANPQPQTGIGFNQNTSVRGPHGNSGAESRDVHSDPAVGTLPRENIVLFQTRATESMITDSVAKESSCCRIPIRGHFGQGKASGEPSQTRPPSAGKSDFISNKSGFLGQEELGNEYIPQNPQISVPKTKKKPMRKKAMSKKAEASGNKILQDKLGLVSTQLPDFCMQYMGTLKEGDDKSSIISKLASNLIASQLPAMPPELREAMQPEASCSSTVTGQVLTDHSTTDRTCAERSGDLEGESFFSRLKETFDQSLPSTGHHLHNGIESVSDTPSCGQSAEAKAPDCSVTQQKMDAEVRSLTQSVKSVAGPSEGKDSSPGLMSPPNNTETKKRDRTRKRRERLPKSGISECDSDSTTQDEDTGTCSRRTKRARLAHKKTSSSLSDCRPDDCVVLSSTDTENNVSEKECSVDNSRLIHLNASEEAVSQIEKTELDLSQLKSRKFSGPDFNVTSLKVYENQLYVCYNGYCARKFDLSPEGSECVQEYHTGNVAVMCMVVTNKGHSSKMTRVFLGGDGQALFIFNAQTGHQIDKHSFGDKIRCLHCRWGHLFLGLNNGAVIIYGLRENKTLGAYRCSSKSVTCMTSATEGVRKILCVAAQDASIGVFDASSGMMLRTLGGHTSVPNMLQTRNHQLFSVSGDGQTLVHDICTGMLDQVLTRSGSYLSAVLPVDVDKELYVLTAGYDKYIRSYNFESKKVEQMYYGAGHSVLTCMTMYKSMIFTGNRDGLVEVVAYDPQVFCPCQVEKCKFVFGLYEHMVYHMRVDHQLVSCSWKSCDQLLSTVDEKAIDDHMTRHLLKS